MNRQSVNFPIIPTADEERLLSQWLTNIREKNEKVAKYGWMFTHSQITSFTGTKDFFKIWNRSEYVFNPLADHILKAVLLVALRFNWPPEEILALWQIEGLPTFRGILPRIPGSSIPGCRRLVDLEREGETWDPVSIQEHGLPRPQGRNEAERMAEARAFARSIVLYWRWGLDILVPHQKDRGDNVLRRVRKKGHDEAFIEGKNQPRVGSSPSQRADQGGFEEQIRPFFSTSPFGYLTDPNRSPIKVRKRNGRWEYGTNSEYQTTMLAMQYARFKYLQTRIPRELDVQGVKLKLAPPFPALMRSYYNCNTNGSRKRLLESLKYLVSEKIKVLGKQKDSYDSNELEFLFTTKEPSRDMRKGMRNDYGPGKCYLGGLRFEVLRRTYKTLFTETL